jgi:uncharacterized protein (DUF849 family)
MRIARIKVCLNGGRMDAGVPRTPGELARSAVAAVAAGAEAVHLHARGPDGRESLAAPHIGAAVTAVREAAGVPVGVSTGLWITGGDAARRQDLVAGWDVLPDFASVNVGEAGYDDLVALLTTAGVDVEAGVWTPEEADRIGTVARILVEVTGGPAVARADAILARLPAHDDVLLHGEGETCWELVAHAGRLGLATRIGLEDTLTGPDGTPADNATLVRAALRVWTAQRNWTAQRERR